MGSLRNNLTREGDRKVLLLSFDQGVKEMPVGSEVSQGYLNLGLAGAALLIILVFVVLLFAFVKYSNKQLVRVMGNWQKSDEQDKDDKVDRLCDKIDSLVTVIHTQLTTNGKDQKMIMELLNQVVNIGLDTQRRVVRIDDRTYLCRGNPSKEVVSELHSKSVKRYVPVKPEMKTEEMEGTQC